MNIKHLATKGAELLPGMIVRFPLDVDDDPYDFREFRIGRLEKIDIEASQATVNALIHDLKEVPDSHDVQIVAEVNSFERSLEHISRCHILADSAFQCVNNPAVRGRVLAPCEEGPPEGRYLDYFVEIDGQTQRTSEANLLVGSTRQDPDPVEQALSYELQNPSWRVPRDHVVEAYGELRSSTFGIEDLVGSRVFLMPHQAKVVTRALSSPECRFMLADEVGLGKTIEASVIFKALRRREPDLRALIVAPASLTHQWRNELNKKFWLDLPIIQPGSGHIRPDEHPGVIISAEDLAEHKLYWDALRRKRWGILIVDEAHHLRKSPELYERICQLSEATERVLILTATPIQRFTSEYLSLLRILDPRRYRAETEETFGQLLEAQRPIRNAITIVRPLIGRDDVDVDELVEELEPLAEHLRDDEALSAMVDELSAMDDDPRAAHEAAGQIVAYVSANYRIESRVIRNRRKSLRLDFPHRTLDTSYSYEPSEREDQTLSDLYDYAQGYLRAVKAKPLAVEYVRLLLHAAASSSEALCDVLLWRQQALRDGHTAVSDELNLLSSAAPRQMEQRARRIVAAAPAPRGEADRVASTLLIAREWQVEAKKLLEGMRLGAMDRPSRFRIGECVRAVYKAVERRKETKVLVFCGWTQTAVALTERLKSFLGHSAVARFTADMADHALQAAADHFQSSAECCVLVCDELGGEGRNFQIADYIVHVDIPWTPAQVEQRIGRVDRLGRTGEVLSLPVFARNTVEHDLFRLWNEGLGLFTSSMSGMEIALEATQNDLVKAMGSSVRDGIAGLIGPMRRKADDLREEVEKERIYEGEGEDRELTEQFKKISEKYRDGTVIRSAVHKWTSMAGLSNFQIRGDTMAYEARNFKLNAMRKARFLPPKMEEAARRLGNSRTTQIVGTFSRDLAVRREDLVFFAPGDDPWTDAVITNALECDRGRCCAVGYRAESARGGSFFELLYSFQIDPRPLYEAGLSKIYLLQAQSYLPRAHMRLLVGLDGSLIAPGDQRWGLIKLPFKASPLTHLGERRKSGRDGMSALDHFRTRYPSDVWAELIERGVDAAKRYIRGDVVEYAAELADEAEQAFRRRAAGWEAGLRWLGRGGRASRVDPALNEYRQATDALADGIRNPICRLESLCFWDLVEEN